jgi:hypothetical protein
VENLAPPLEFLMDMRFGLEKGQSLKKTLQLFIENQNENIWGQQIAIWMKFLEIGRPTSEVVIKMTPTRRQCLELIELGLKGEPIYQQVCLLEEEIFELTKLEIEEFVATLPIKSLIPLLFFQFPAFLALLIGPFLASFLAQA